MKFLKKDVSEANACAAVIERIALSHPEISFKLIRDGKQALITSGDGNIKGTVYSVLGREFSSSLIEVTPENSPVSVSGLICKPVSCKPTRNNQFTFLNGRLVRSGTVIAATEQAYKNSAMVGKFPAYVLYITVPLDTVDVNVHPAKTEVRFSDEKMIFDAVYIAVKKALTRSDTRPEIKLNNKQFNPFVNEVKPVFKQEKIETKTIAEEIYKKPPVNSFVKTTPAFRDKTSSVFVENYSENSQKYTPKTDVNIEVSEPEINIREEISKKEDTLKFVEEETPQIKLIGEAFDTYIVVQMKESIYLIDKHAAHERILFNELKANTEISVQQLLSPLTVMLSADEYNSIVTNLDLVNKSGFDIEDFGNSTVLIRAIPSFLASEDINSLISEIAENISKTGMVSTEKEENLFHTVACKAAIKAGYKTTSLEMQSLAEKVLLSKDIMYCPHGRPVAFEIKKRELEKQFGRIQ